MADNSRHRGGRRRVTSLAALGLLAGTTWLLLARPGLPSPAADARSVRQLGHMQHRAEHPARTFRTALHAPHGPMTVATPTPLALAPLHPRAHSRLAVRASTRPLQHVLPTPRSTRRHTVEARATSPQPAP